MSPGDVWREVRSRAGLTQKELGDLVKTNAQWVCRRERGETAISHDDTRQVHEALLAKGLPGFTVDDLLQLHGRAA